MFSLQALIRISGILPARSLQLICLLGVCSFVETELLGPMVSGTHVIPPPGLRSVWNDLTPLVAAAMQSGETELEVCCFQTSIILKLQIKIITNNVMSKRRELRQL